MLKPVTCTAFSTQSLPWHLHGEQDYFVTIKVRDTAGQYVTASSTGYRHDIKLASQGIVQDIDTDSSKQVMLLMTRSCMHVYHMPYINFLSSIVLDRRL